MEGRYTGGDYDADRGGIENTGFQLQENSESYLKNGAVLNQTTTLQVPPKRKKSLVQLTKEALPRLENYRNSRKAVKRPSLGELHEGEESVKVSLLLLNLNLFLSRRKDIKVTVPFEKPILIKIKIRNKKYA